MFNKDEIKRNLLGCLEVALFMPQARNRFGNNRDEALRSFIIPILLFPMTMLMVYANPHQSLNAEISTNTIALLYSLRTVASWLLFLGSVYWLMKEVGKIDYFWEFVIANNWLSIPATAVFLPVVCMLFNGTHSWEELYPFMLSLMIYTYAFTAFMASWVLRIPMELAGFIAIIGFMINDYTGDIMTAVSTTL